MRDSNLTPAPTDLAEQAVELLEIGQVDNAEALLLAVLRATPDHLTALFHLGRIHLDRKNLRPAAGFLAKAYQVAPDVWQTGALFGYCLWQLEDFANAVQVFKQANGLIPDDPDHLRQWLVCQVMSRALTPDNDPVFWSRVGQHLLRYATLNEQIEFLESCGLARNAPTTHNDNIFNNLLQPFIQMVLDAGGYSLALAWQQFTFLKVALFPHTQAHWARYLDRLNPMFVQAGLRLKSELGPAPDALSDAGPPVVAIIFEESVAHGSGFTLLLSILEQLARAGSQRMRLVVYTLVPAPAELLACGQACGIHIADFSTTGAAQASEDSVRVQLLALRARAHQDGVALALFFSTFEAIVCLAASFGIAPRHGYFTMMFHSISAPGLDAYFAGASLGAGTRLVRGRPWLTLPPALPDPFAALGPSAHAELLDEAGAIRARLLARFSTILGTIGRAEKIDDAFVDVVAQLLKRNPGSVFLWFGHADSPLVPTIQAWFQARGVGARCLFVGWVDTRVYAHVLDIHLDCFGLPTGLTMAQTFSAGRAYVLKRGPEADLIGMTPLLAGLQDDPHSPLHAEARALLTDPDTGDNLMMVAQDVPQYIEYAHRLIQNPALRHKVGQAAKRFMNRYFHASDHMGQVFVEQLLGVVQTPAQTHPNAPTAGSHP